jgi:tetratricopeptide (TPR) repeat protein
MGACIFFKSVGSEKIDPDLISGFISAVSSFGKEIESQKSLNEMKYGDKTLLLSDGEYVRVAIVLNKKASLPLRRNLKEFVKRFEERYEEALPGWAGQLKLFNDADDLVDKIFNTSIILPHRLTYQASDVKKLESSFGKELLNIAEDIIEETGRDFLFIAKLLDTAKEESNKDIAEIFMAIKELREEELFNPIDISELEEKKITAKERERIEQKVNQLSNLTQEEKQRTIEELITLNPGEREAYIASLEDQTEIVSAPVKSIVDETVIEDKKQAKKEIKKFEEKAEKERDIHNYEKAIEIYKEAGIIANDWDLKKKFLNLQEEIRQTEIKKFEINMDEAISKAKSAEKRGEYETASKMFKKAASMASEIFKLGVNKMNKQVKELTKKSKELLQKSKK